MLKSRTLHNGKDLFVLQQTSSESSLYRCGVKCSRKHLSEVKHSRTALPIQIYFCRQARIDHHFSWFTGFYSAAGERQSQASHTYMTKITDHWLVRPGLPTTSWWDQGCRPSLGGTRVKDHQLVHRAGALSCCQCIQASRMHSSLCVHSSRLSTETCAFHVAQSDCDCFFVQTLPDLYVHFRIPKMCRQIMLVTNLYHNDTI